MCGIHGIITPHPSSPELRPRLVDMGTAQGHRGPDDRLEMTVPLPTATVGLGFVRLSILDLDTGMQPIVCDQDQTAIMCNGQIYNYVELKPRVAESPFKTKGDIEVALHLYRQRGLGFLDRLNGMYAGAILDPNRNRLILFRDRFGIKPLYYMQNGTDFLFASEIKALLAATGPVKPELNRSQLGTYFGYRYVPGTETLFKGIHKVPPGAFLVYDLTNHTFHIKRYWEQRFDPIDTTLDQDTAAEQFWDLFKDAVRIRLRSDVEVGTLLSGGIDSSAVSALAVGHQPTMRMFSIGFEEAIYNELPDIDHYLSAFQDRFAQARHHTRICSKDHLEQLPAMVRAVEEPISLGTMLPTDQVCRLAADKVKVVLTGEGADEIFGGYRKFLIETAAAAFPQMSPEERQKWHAQFPELVTYLKERKPDPFDRYIQTELLFGPTDLETLLGTSVELGLPRKDRPVLREDTHPLNAMLAIESRTRLPNYVILRLDKLAMAHSLEARTPFLDYRLAQWANRLPIHLKIDLARQTDKAICRHTFQRYGLLDPQSATRAKKPFTIPLAHWLSRPRQLPENIQEIMLGDRIDQQGILNPRIMKDLVNRLSPRGVAPHTLVSNADQVYAIIVFTLWYDHFMSARSD